MLVKMILLSLNIYHLIVSYGNVSESEQIFESIINFLDELKSNTDGTMEFVVKIQAIFCPEQQTCYREEMQERNDELNALPATVQVGNKTVRVTNVQAFMGVCCFPCSCSDNCKLDGNCCVSKFISINKNHGHRPS